MPSALPTNSLLTNESSTQCSINSLPFSISCCTESLAILPYRSVCGFCQYHPVFSHLYEALQQSLSYHSTELNMEMTQPEPVYHCPPCPLGYNSTNACSTCTVITILNRSNCSIVPIFQLLQSSSNLCCIIQCSSLSNPHYHFITSPAFHLQSTHSLQRPPP